MDRRASLLPPIGFCILLVALTAALRIFPIAPNFSAVGAAALCAGWILRGRPWLALGVPIVAMLISDAVLADFVLRTMVYDWRIMLVVYAALAAPALAGRLLGAGPVVWRVGAAALAGSLLFFFSSNFAHWAFFNTYPRTLPGLVECYVAALPFFKFSLLGDLLFSGVFFGAAVLLRRFWERYADQVPAPAMLTRA